MYDLICVKYTGVENFIGETLAGQGTQIEVKSLSKLGGLDTRQSKRSRGRSCD